MTTVEISPFVEEHIDEEEPPVECHLYLHNSVFHAPPHAMCGLPVEKDRHPQDHGVYGEWKKGIGACEVCGAPICLSCLLVAS